MQIFIEEIFKLKDCFEFMIYVLITLFLFYFVSSVDLSLYKDESQIEKKSPGKRKSSSLKKRKNSNDEECIYGTPSKRAKLNANTNSGKTKTTSELASPKVCPQLREN